jgi:hypothetical protein
VIPLTFHALARGAGEAAALGDMRTSYRFMIVGSVLAHLLRLDVKVESS